MAHNGDWYVIRFITIKDLISTQILIHVIKACNSEDASLPSLYYYALDALSNAQAWANGIVLLRVKDLRNSLHITEANALTNVYCRLNDTKTKGNDSIFIFV